VATLRLKLILTALSLGLALLCAWVLHVTGIGTWSLTKFSQWCVGTAPLSVLLAHLFKPERDLMALFQWRGVCVGVIGVSIVLIAADSLPNAEPELGLIAFFSTLASLLVVQVFAEYWFRKPPNKSLERTRER
jgi:hypothetical protein